MIVRFGFQKIIFLILLTSKMLAKRIFFLIHFLCINGLILVSKYALVVGEIRKRDVSIPFALVRGLIP